MKSICFKALEVLQSGNTLCLATVLRTWGSAPRKSGAHMLITQDNMQGSVSGGCVENDVFRQAQELMITGSTRVVHYGVSDEDAWHVGLSCGGEIDVLLEVFSGRKHEDVLYWQTLADAIRQDHGALVVHPLEGSQGRLVIPATACEDETTLHRAAREAFVQRTHRLVDVDGVRAFVEVVPPRQVLLIFGAAHLAVELVKLARQFDFYTIVIDPKAFFIESTKLAADECIAAWPAEVLADISLTPYTYAVTLSHDPKIDDQALQILLRSDVAYIGALGSKKTHVKRKERLHAMGCSEEEMQQIHSPVGIDIRAQSAQEIALSIITDIIREKNKFIG